MILLNNKEEIENWLAANYIKRYQLIDDKQYGFVVNVNDNVDLSYSCLSRIQVKFNVIKGSFWVSNNQLTSLEGCPEEIYGEFHCEKNKLSSLLHGPKKVTNSYYANENQLISLEGAPSGQINTVFNVSMNQLVSLVGSPHKVKGYYNAGYNQLTNLEGMPLEVGDLNLIGNKISSTKGISKQILGLTILSANQLNMNSFEELPDTALKGFVLTNNKLLNFSHYQISLDELRAALEKYHLDKMILRVNSENSVLKL